IKRSRWHLKTLAPISLQHLAYELVVLRIEKEKVFSEDLLPQSYQLRFDDSRQAVICALAQALTQRAWSQESCDEPWYEQWLAQALTPPLRPDSSRAIEIKGSRSQKHDAVLTAGRLKLLIRTRELIVGSAVHRLTEQQTRVLKAMFELYSEGI